MVSMGWVLVLCLACYAAGVVVTFLFGRKVASYAVGEATAVVKEVEYRAVSAMANARALAVAEIDAAKSAAKTGIDKL
jgi:hypothetical protein